MIPDELLEYAAKDPATWSKDEVRRLLREAATAITKQQQDAERYRFIRDSTPEQFDQFEPGLYSGGDELDELTDAAMAGANAEVSRERSESA